MSSMAAAPPSAAPTPMVTVRSVLMVIPKLSILVFAFVFAIYMSKLTCCSAFLASEIGVQNPRIFSAVAACVVD